MGIVQSIVLGIVQGVGEFLPVSSSAHLIVVPWLFGWQEHSLAFDVALHAGTLVAVLAYFWRDWFGIIRGRFLWYIAVASVPGAVIGKLLEEKAETVFRSPALIACAMGIFAVIFYFIDRYSRKTRTLKSLNFLDSLLIGISQALAIVPGVSRSGVTMATGIGLKFDREAAARFSFLLSAPIILGATVLKLKDIGALASGENGLSLFAGFIVSAATGFLSIRFLLNYLKRHSFTAFVIYRLVFSLVIFLFIFARR
ncbi:MAG: undecaprenyl-diphosphate phosphatase [Candidatus Omnitrophica bacterium]|nr:undecaprenyl-diphosphate phosphatase [Candidatus Omnitrophota bacterium]MDD5310503.1 undecaprenyl-diphosphate phosphatase [Candidatus Omnitrophota bacterium]MDD5546071.1 undecaprenyl-diphosphate phosphatase [Candidatus Omnitrophota bacterium]